MFPKSHGDGPPASEATEHSRLNSVLLVDDDELLRQVVDIQLRRDGYEVVPVGTVADALEAIRSRRFDSAIVEVDLPDGNGLTVVSELLLRSACASLVLSCHPPAKVASQAATAGAFRMIYKPVAFDKIRSRLKETLAQTSELRDWFPRPSCGDAGADTANPSVSDCGRAACRSPFQADGLLHKLAAAKAHVHGLTPKETEVYLHLVAGYDYEGIGNELGSALGTVKRHAANIRSKCGVASNNALWRELALELGELLDRHLSIEN